MDVKQMHNFLSGLAGNNTREWMTEHKAEYQSARQNFIDLVQHIIDETSVFDPEIAGEEAKKSIFRLNRDIRFSNNKDPYKTNFGGSITKDGRKSGNPGYYIHLQPGNNFAGGGLYQPIPESLKKIRQEIDYNADELRGIIGTKEFTSVFNEPFGDMVKTAPKGYSKDNPNIDLLRYKSFVYMKQFSDKEAQSPDFPEKVLETFRAMKPYLDFLRRGLD